MEKTLYILGAGFSAPLGLPVVSNFLEMAKDIYFSDTARYKYFASIFEEIRAMHRSKSYYEADLTNIEEILSILDMTNSLSDTDKKVEFKEFISDVILYYTPEMPFATTGHEYTTWHTRIWEDQKDYIYGLFISALLNLQWTFIPYANNQMFGIVNFSDSEPRDQSYSVITLNYDLILENMSNAMKAKSNGLQTFIREEQEGDDIARPYLAKLHGSIDSKEIIPPTWNKSLRPSIEKEWKLAYKLLSEANHIRILGYSLPSTDSYIRYLFKTSVLESRHLKSIDIICKDKRNEVQKRYEEFVSYKKLRFANQDISEYLKVVSQATNLKDWSQHYKDAVISHERHDSFMDKHNLVER